MFLAVGFVSFSWFQFVLSFFDKCNYVFFLVCFHGEKQRETGMKLLEDRGKEG